MSMHESLEVEGCDEQVAIDAAIGFLRRDISDLSERAEALDLDDVVQLLVRALDLCLPQVPDSQPH